MDMLPLARRLLAAGRHAEALELAEAQLDRAPCGSPWPLLAASSLLALGRLDAARDRALQEEACRVGGRSPELDAFWGVLGRRAFLDERYALAAEALGKSLRGAADGRGEAQWLLACALEALGRFAEALDLLEGLDRPGAEALMQRALLLQRLGRPAQALAAGGRAAAQAPDSEPMALNYGILLASQGRRAAALRHWRAFVRAHGPAPLLETRLAFTLPPVLGSERMARTLRRRLASVVRAPGAALPGRPEHLLSMPPFYLAFHGQDDRQLLTDIAHFFARRTSLAGMLPPADPLGERLAALRPAGQRRIGFLSWHFGPHTLMSYFFRLLLAVAPRIGQCFFLAPPQPDNAFSRSLGAVGTRVTLPASGPERLAALHAAVASLDLDVLVHLDLGMDLAPWLLAFTRPARVQCALYGHPVTTGIGQVDFFLSPAALEPEGAQAHYAERLRALPGLLSGFLPVARTGAAEGAGGVRYLCAQSLFKLHPQMDAVFAAILRQDGDARLALYVARDRAVTAAARRRLRRSLGADFRRVDWLPQCSEQAFLSQLAGADAVLDTMHFSGGATSYKALGCGIPVVTHAGAFLRGRQTAGLYRHMGVQGPVAADADAMAALALRLAHSPGWRRDLSRQLQEAAPRLFETEASAEGLAAFLNGDMA